LAEVIDLTGNHMRVLGVVLSHAKTPNSKMTNKTKRMD